MKQMLLLLVSMLLLSGCMGQQKVLETEMAPSVQTASTEAGEDTELKRLDTVLGNGDALTLSVIGKQVPDGEMCGVREVRVYRDEELIQTVEMAEAIRADGVDGIAPGYTESFFAEETVCLKDVDFDGNPDLEVIGWIPNNAIPYYYWLWDEAEARFEYAFTLQLRDVDTQNRQLVAWYEVESGLYHTDYYRVNAEKELELLKREVEDVRP